MKIFVAQIVDAEQLSMLELEIDPQTPIGDIANLIEQHLKKEVVLLPIRFDFHAVQTVGDYYQQIDGGSRPIHFNVIPRDALNEDEQAILATFNFCEPPVSTIHQPDELEKAQRFVHLMAKILPEDIQESLVVRFADKTNMFGRTFKDTITREAKLQEARSSVQVHPYPWLAAGASNVIVHQNSFNELSVALVYNKRRDRRLLSDPQRQVGIPDFLKLPEGYMHPKPCKGGEQGIALTSGDHMDEAEELLLKNVPMQKAYQIIKEKQSHLGLENPSSTYDNSTIACAIRESHEEVGLTLSADQVQFVTQREENRLLPTIANVFLIKTKEKSIEPPALTADGIEIAEALWGKLRAFYFKKDVKQSGQFQVVIDYYDQEGNAHAIEVPIKYALMIGQAIQRFRENEIQQQSAWEGQPLFSSRENVEARVRQILHHPSLNPERKTLVDIMGLPPESQLGGISLEAFPGDSTQENIENRKALSQLGKLADDYYHKINALVNAFKNMPLDKPFNAATLETRVNDGPIIESNQLLSRALHSQPVVKATPTMLTPPLNNPRKTVDTRRQECHGSGVVSFLEENAPAVNEFLIRIRNDIIRIVDPERTPSNCPRKLAELIKTKSLHASFYAPSAPFIEKQDYFAFFNAQDGLDKGAFLYSVEQKLTRYLNEQEPCLMPVGLEFKEEDGTILARYRVQTNDNDERPLLSLKKLLDSGRQSSLPAWDPHPLRDNTVAIVLCVVAVREDAHKVAQIKAVLTAAEGRFKALGKQPITNCSIIKEYDKRTITRGKHVTIFSEVYKNSSENTHSSNC